MSKEEERVFDEETNEDEYIPKSSNETVRKIVESGHDIVFDDIDADIQPPPKRPHELGPLDPNDLPPGYYLDNAGVIRDKTKHFMVKGGNNLKTRGLSKIAPLVRKLKDKINDGDILLDEIHKLITYDHDKDTYVNSKGKVVRVRYPKVKESDRIAAIKLMLAYMYGRPHTQITVDKTVDVKIEAKMHQVAELVSQNRENLKLINGGKEETVEAEYKEVKDG